MKCTLSRIGHALIPANTETENWFKKHPSDHYQFDIRISRNYRFHKKFFAMLNIAFDNLPENMAERYPTVERLLIGVKIIIGHCTEYILDDGRIVQVPKSIDFESMEDEDFALFYDKARHVLSNYFLADADPETVSSVLGDF